MPGFGGRQVSRISAALEVTNDLVDHYASLAFYLRLNGLLPPRPNARMNAGAAILSMPRSWLYFLRVFFQSDHLA